MKGTLISMCAIVACLLMCGCARQQQDNGKTLKVLSWNVWHGGHSKEYPGRGCEGTIGILRQSEADVIMMVETYGAAPMVSDSLGYPYHLISSNLSIYSRYPIVEEYAFDEVSGFNFGGVRLDVDGSPVRVFATWLHYLPDARLVPINEPEEDIIAWETTEGSRVDEIHSILSCLQPILAEADSIPVIMGGDFNTHSHLDWTEATRGMYNHGDAVVRWPVSVAMQDAGFKDSFREMNPDPARHPGVTWLTDADSLATECRQDRIDFIYYQGSNIRAVASECYDNSLGKPLQLRGPGVLLSLGPRFRADYI